MASSASESGGRGGRKRRGEPTLAETLQPLNDEGLQTAVTEIVQHLLDNPAKIMHATVKVLSDGMLPKKAEQSEVPKDEEPFSDRYITVSSTPKEWIKDDLCEFEPAIFTEDVTNQIEKSERESTLPFLLTSAPVCTVKNTFIHIVSDEEEDAWARARRRYRTWPSIATRAHATRRYSTPCSPAVMAMAPLQPLSSEQQGEAREEATLEVEPLESGQPQESKGSAHHPKGCKPCAWFWRPQGCGNGAQCGHCHMCPEGAKQIKKYANKCLARALKLEQSGKGSPAV